MVRRVLIQRSMYKLSYESVIMMMLIVVAFLDVVFSEDPRVTKELFSEARVLVQCLKLMMLVGMIIYVFRTYRPPTFRPVLHVEIALWYLLILITFNMIRYEHFYQVACALRAMSWIFTYFFFRSAVLRLPAIKGKMYLYLLALALFALAILQTWRAFQWWVLNHGEQAELFSSSAAFSLQCIILLVLAFSRLNRRTILMVVCLSLAVLFTMKRSAILSVACSIPIILVSLRRLRYMEAQRALSIGCILLIVVVAPLLYGSIAHRFTAIADDGGSSRSWRYDACLDRWWNAESVQWVIGYGFFDTSFYLQDIFYSRRPSVHQLPLHAHSDVFQLLPDLGLLGLLWLLMMHAGMIGLIWYCWRMRDPHLIFLGVFYVFYLTYAFLNGSVAKYETTYYMLPFAAVCCALEGAYGKTRSLGTV